MFVAHNELIWMLRQVDGQRVHHDKLLRKFTNHGVSSLLPHYPGIDAIFEQSDDKSGAIRNFIRALEARLNRRLDSPADCFAHSSYRDLESGLLPVLVEVLKQEKAASLETGTRVMVRLDSSASYVKPGSEGFVSEKSAASSRVKFYTIPGRYSVDSLSMEVPDEELEVLEPAALLGRHRDYRGVAQYFFNDCLLRSMRSRLDASIYAYAAQLAIEFLVDEGYVKIDGEEYVSVPDRIFSVLAPQLDQTYRNTSLFSSQSLSSPPSERKPHVLRLELTTGCDYNRCTFCSEYAEMTPVTKSFAQFREHVDQVTASIGTEKNRIQRLFIGSGNSLGVETGLLLEALHYASSIYNPQRISLYGRTASILEKSLDELKTLKEAGLCMLYWGLESGSDAVLNYVCKDCTRHDMVEAAQRLAAAEIEVSAMLMPGVGGLKLSAEHVAGTLELLHNIEISYLTLLAINPSEKSPYAKNIKAEADNRPLTADEVNAQVYQLLAGLEPTGLQIGMFTEEVDQVSSNTIRFNYQFTDSNKELLLRDFWT
jgi:hypothetical protein